MDPRFDGAVGADQSTNKSANKLRNSSPVTNSLLVAARASIAYIWPRIPPALLDCARPASFFPIYFLPGNLLVCLQRYYHHDSVKKGEGIQPVCRRAVRWLPKGSWWYHSRQVLRRIPWVPTCNMHEAPTVSPPYARLEPSICNAQPTRL